MTRRKILKALVCAGLMLLVAGSAGSEESSPAGRLDPGEAFNMANGYYEKGEYDRAIEGYNNVLEAGYESGSLYYNLADAYMKAGKLGRAILNYDRARLFLSRDADLNANYAFARSTIKGRVLPENSIWNWRPLRLYAASFTVNELLLVSSAVYIFIFVLLFLMVVLPAQRGYISALIGLMILCIILNLVVLKHNVDITDKSAIVVEPRIEARFGPVESATKFFDLGEGMKVTILNEKDDWYKVKRADGKVGWVRANEVEKIR